MTSKEIFLETLKPDGKPERMLKQYEALNFRMDDPLTAYMFGGVHPGATSINPWGVTVTWPVDHPGIQPITTDDLKVLKDITHWRDYVKMPDVENECRSGWEEFTARATAENGDRLLCAWCTTGLFEHCHFLMGFADTLTNLYEHPAEMHELIDCLCEFKLKCLKVLFEKMKPEVIVFHDDWGTKTQLFMHPDMWREFFKEPYRKIYKYIRESGVIAVHHADSYLAPIVEDMVELGIQCWQGVLPENDIPALQAKLGGRMTLMGGIGAAIDTPDSTEDEIRAYVRDALERYCPGGHFIPCITYGGPGTIFKHVDPIINSEIDKYNSEAHGEAKTVCTKSAAAEEKTAEKKAAEAGIAAEIADALATGRKDAVLALVNDALDGGMSAADILENGLVAGMNDLGEAFSAGDVFIPEMLMAAKSMSDAMAILKPKLAAGEAKAAGKAVMGTVCGDLHDIGKNIVKIMLEGSGIEVIDLGVDVSAEDFVRTAKEQKCDIIACSSLLTTAMNEMARVVELAKAEGIRDSVTIMVGGAPITQEFCDRIGADIYTPDAASCARCAVELLKTAKK